MPTDVDVVEKEKVELKKPGKWAVVLHNDDVTPMEFVVELLRHVFHMSYDQAIDIMMSVHTNGKGVAGIYVYEMAEQKYAESLQIVKINGMALKITLEEE